MRNQRNMPYCTSKSVVTSLSLSYQNIGDHKPEKTKKPITFLSRINIVRFSRILIFGLVHKFWVSSWDAFPKHSILVPDVLFSWFLILQDSFAWRMWNWHQNVWNLIRNLIQMFWCKYNEFLSQNQQGNFLN